MGTLTWTVWLLLAFIALASNFEVGEAYIPANTNIRTKYLCDYIDRRFKSPWPSVCDPPK